MEQMEQFIQNILIGVRQWVNGKLEDLSFVISSHINSLTERMTTAEADIDALEAAEIHVDSNDKVLNLDNHVLSSQISLVHDSTAHKIKLLGKGAAGSEELISEFSTEPFITDAVLDAAGFYRFHAATLEPAADAYWEKVSGDTITLAGDVYPSAVDGHEYIVLKWNADSPTSNKLTFIDAAGLIDAYTAGTGLTLSGNEFSLKTASTAEIGGVTVAATSTISNTSGAVDVKLAATDPGIAKDNTGALYIPTPTVEEVLAVLEAEEEPTEAPTTEEPETEEPGE